MRTHAIVSRTGAFLATFLLVGSSGTFAQPAAVSVTAAAAAQEHQRELDLLHLSVLRPPADATHPSSPAYANYDEGVAERSSAAMPDPLVMEDGKKVATAKQWWAKRRPEILAAFERDIIGKRPENLPTVTWQVVSVANEAVEGVQTITKRLTGHVDNALDPAIQVNIDLEVVTPAQAKGKRVPVIMVMGSLAPPPASPSPAGPTSQQKGQYPDYRQQILERGWGYAIYVPTSVQADSGAGLNAGIIGLVNKGAPRSLDDWGTLSAWGWGASKAVDYLETDRDVDAKRLGLFGHSRFGKAAVVTMIYDPRFVVGYISSSGKGGAAPYRRVFGATVENMASPQEFHWSSASFMKYAADPLSAKDMPVDANEAIALIAPRAVFGSAGIYWADPAVAPGDGWVDAKGTFEAEVSAGPVYRLLGYRGLDSPTFPPALTLVDGGRLAFRQHDEGHTPNPNWSYFLAFAAKQFARH